MTAIITWDPRNKIFIIIILTRHIYTTSNLHLSLSLFALFNKDLQYQQQHIFKKVLAETYMETYIRAPAGPNWRNSKL